jgi:chromate transport protein ChrA
MCFCIALLHAGIISAIFAFLLWSLPGAIGMYGLSLGVQKMPERLPPTVYALLSGLNASTVGIVALAAVQLAEKAIKDRLTRILVIFGACAGLCYNALWYFPVLIVAGGLTTVMWDVWLRQRVGKMKTAYLAKRRRARDEQGDAEEVQATTQSIPVELARPEAVKRRQGAGCSTDRIVPEREEAGRSHAGEHPVVEDVAAKNEPVADVADVRTHNISVKVGVSLIVGFLLSFIVVMVIRGTVSSGRSFNVFSNM